MRLRPELASLRNDAYRIQRSRAPRGCEAGKIRTRRLASGADPHGYIKRCVSAAHEQCDDTAGGLLLNDAVELLAAFEIYVVDCNDDVAALYRRSRAWIRDVIDDEPIFYAEAFTLRRRELTHHKPQPILA